VLIDHLERLVELLGSYTCNHHSQLERHSEDKSDRDCDYPNNNNQGYSKRRYLEQCLIRDVLLELESEYNSEQCDIEGAVEVHKEKSHMSWCYLASFGNEADPKVVLQFLIEKAHLGVRILAIVLHCDIIYPLSAGTQSCGNSKDLSASAFLELLLLFFGELLIDFDLWRHFRFSAFLRRIFASGLFLDELTVFIDEVLNNKILDDTLNVLHIVIVELGQVIPVLLLCHLKSLQLISPRIIDKT
jgi:hypothetical protein